MVRKRLTDVAAALRYWPRREHWGRTGLELAWAVPILLLLAYAGDLVRPIRALGAMQLAGLGVTLLFVPALGEELIFRALLIPRDRPGPTAMLGSTLLFVLWHPLQAVTIGPPWSGAFLNPWFLACTGLLGWVLARIYAATGSVWPCVAAHWLVVFGWKALLGGPF
jgi:predicted Abi (CAAX) family protease